MLRKFTRLQKPLLQLATSLKKLFPHLLAIRKKFKNSLPENDLGLTRISFTIIVPHLHGTSSMLHVIIEMMMTTLFLHLPNVSSHSFFYNKFYPRGSWKCTSKNSSLKCKSQIIYEQLYCYVYYYYYGSDKFFEDG